MSDDRGKQFDILDKALAARGYELYARPWIYRQDYDNWINQYNQLDAYARSNSDNSYIARQWSDEEPRYVNAPAALFSKVRVADPINYDTSIPISGKDCSSCCGNVSSLPGVGIDGGSFGSGPIHGGSSYSFGNVPGLGDNLRGFFSPNSLPFFPSPSDTGNKLIDTKEVGSGILVALIVGVILWVVHYFTKKNA